MNYILQNALLVNEGRCEKGELRIKDGKIEEISFESDRSNDSLPASQQEAGYRILNLDGACILPGIIDDHVHFRQPGFEHKADIASESLAALQGGVTSFMDMPNTRPQTLTRRLLEEKYAIAAQNSLLNYSFYMGCSEDNLQEVLQTDPESVCGIKLFLGSSTGNMLVRDERYLEELFRHAPTLIAVHCEDESIIARHTAAFKERYGSDAPFSIHPLVRSAEACYTSSYRAAEMARKYGARLHILHLSTARELSLLDPILPTGDPSANPYATNAISGEACIHYLWFTDRDYAEKTWRIKCNPAIKTSEDREALRQAVKNGQVLVATDHAPHTFEEKQKPYFECPSGSPWVGHSLAMMLEFVHRGIFTLPEVVTAMCHRPAQLFGIKNRGFLRPGYAADLAVVDPEKAWTVSKENIPYKCGWFALENETLHGQVRSVFVNGNPVYENGQIKQPEYRGERLEFNYPGR